MDSYDNDWPFLDDDLFPVEKIEEESEDKSVHRVQSKSDRKTSR